MSVPPDPPAITITFSGREKRLRLSSPNKWAQAVRNGDLTASTPVEVTRGAEVQSCRADSVPELAGLFSSASDAAPPTETEPAAPSAPADDAGAEVGSTGDGPWGPVSAADTETEPAAAASAEAEQAATTPVGVMDEAPAESDPEPAGCGAAVGLLVLVALAFAVVIAVMLSMHHPAKPAASASDGLASSAAASGAPSGQPAPIEALVSWRADTDSAEKTYLIGGMTLTLSSQVGAGGVVTPMLHVTTANGQQFDAPGKPGTAPASASLGVGRIDPYSNAYEIILVTYTGGAHCCTDIQVLDCYGGAWRALDLGGFEGGLSAFPKDLDADGGGDIVVTDDRFAYAFASFADSYLPPRVFSVARGAVTDVSATGRFGPLFQTDIQDAQKSCLAHNNGGCAAFVADAARLGQAGQAWPIMLANFNRQSDWRLPAGCRSAAPDGACPAGQTVTFDNYPDALNWFLANAGYVAPAWRPPEAAADPSAEPAADAATQTAAPSFDCSRALSQNLQLICATPALANADRALAAAYQAAMARTSDRGQLQRDEQAWIRARNNAPYNIVILEQMYADRISALANIGQAPGNGVSPD